MLENWLLFSVLLFGQVTFSLLVGWFLSDSVKEQDLLASLSFTGGILGLTLFCLMLIWANIRLVPTTIIPLVAIFLWILGRRWKQIKNIFSLPLVWWVLFFLVVLNLRLLFIQNLLVPSYADAVQHVQIVQDMLAPDQPAQAFYHISSDFNHYYHFGFHALAAWLSGVAHADPNRAILVLGQYFQALAIIGLYPLARILFKAWLPAWLVMVSGGLFLPLPAYASNWSKYPALASVVGVIFVLALLTMYVQAMVTAQTFSKKLYWLIAISILASFFLHSRTLLLLFIAAVLGFIFCHKLVRQTMVLLVDDEATTKTMAAFGVSLLVTMMVMTLNLPFHALFGVLLIGALWIAFYAQFGLTLFFSLFLLASFGLSRIQATIWGHSVSLLDRPYIAIFLYIPISFFLATSLNWLLNIVTLPFWRKSGFAAILIIGAVTALFLQDHRPSDCCVFVNDDDLFSFAWIQENIPANTILGIAALGEPGNFLPVDGGAWVEAMTGIATRRIASNTNFLVDSSSLCKVGIKYVYVDGLEYSFDPYSLIDSGAQQLLNFGSVSVFKLNCG